MSDWREIDLQSHPFLVALQTPNTNTKIYAFYQQVAAANGLVLIPPLNKLPKQFDHPFTKQHILLPRQLDSNPKSSTASDQSTVKTTESSIDEEEGERSRSSSTSSASAFGASSSVSLWVNLMGELIQITDGYLYVPSEGTGMPRAKILFEELHYNDDFQSFRVLAIDNSMCINPLSAKNGQSPSVNRNNNSFTTVANRNRASVSVSSTGGSDVNRFSTPALNRPSSASVSTTSIIMSPSALITGTTTQPEARSLSAHRDVLTRVLGEAIATRSIFASPRLDFFFTDFSLAWLSAVVKDATKAATHISGACARALQEAVRDLRQNKKGAAAVASWPTAVMHELEISIQAHVYSCLHAKIFQTLTKIPSVKSQQEQYAKNLSMLDSVSLFDVGVSSHLIGVVDPRAAIEQLKLLNSFVTPLERLYCLQNVEQLIMDSMRNSLRNQREKKAMGQQQQQLQQKETNADAAPSGSPPTADEKSTRSSKYATADSQTMTALLAAAAASSNVARTAALPIAPGTSSQPTGSLVGASTSPALGPVTIPTAASSASSPIRTSSSSVSVAASILAVSLPPSAHPSTPAHPSSVSASQATSPQGGGAPTTDASIAATPSPEPNVAAVGQLEQQLKTNLSVNTLDSSPPPSASAPPFALPEHGSVDSVAGAPSSVSASPPSAATNTNPNPSPPLSTTAASRSLMETAEAVVSVSADDLLPLLVHVLLEARPDSVYANIAYMRDFGPQSSLLGAPVFSSLAYRLANFEAAVSYIHSGKLLEQVRSNPSSQQKKKARTRINSVSVHSTQALQLLLTPVSSHHKNLFRREAMQQHANANPNAAQHADMAESKLSVPTVAEGIDGTPPDGGTSFSESQNSFLLSDVEGEDEVEDDMPLGVSFNERFAVLGSSLVDAAAAASQTNGKSAKKQPSQHDRSAALTDGDTNAYESVFDDPFSSPSSGANRIRKSSITDAANGRHTHRFGSSFGTTSGASGSALHPEDDPSNPGRARHEKRELFDTSLDDFETHSEMEPPVSGGAGDTDTAEGRTIRFGVTAAPLPSWLTEGADDGSDKGHSPSASSGATLPRAASVNTAATTRASDALQRAQSTLTPSTLSSSNSFSTHAAPLVSLQEEEDPLGAIFKLKRKA